MGLEGCFDHSGHGEDWLGNRNYYSEKRCSSRARDDRFGTVVYFELAQEAMDVPFDGADLDEEPGCYLPV